MNIQLDKLHNGEYIKFLKNVIILTQEKSLVKEDLKTIINHLSVQVDKLDQVLELKGHTLTVKIKEADTKRDQAFNGLKGIVKSYLNHYNATTVDQAKQVMHLIQRFGVKVSKLNYQKETEYIDVLVSELNKLEAEQGLLTNLGIIDWTQELNALNKTFDELYLSRTISIAEKGIQSVTSLRIESDETYRQLKKVLKAIIVLKTFKNEPMEAYEVTKQNLDELAKGYTSIIRLRKAKAKESSSNEEQID